MREYTTRKDNKPRFFGGVDQNTIIVDETGYHEFCKVCKCIVLEYLVDAHTPLSDRTCHCSNAGIDTVVTQLYHALDQCQDVEAVKRMLMMFVSKREMQG